jgi:parallel beta-helix repeat protein
MLFLPFIPALAVQPDMPEIETIVITEDTTLEAGEVMNARIVIKASHITVDGNGVILQGPGDLPDDYTDADLAVYENAGPAIFAEGVNNVTLKNFTAKGWEMGLELHDAMGWRVEGNNFSDNYYHPKFGWGEIPERGGIILHNVDYSVFVENTANRVHDALTMHGSDDNLFMENDFSNTSNVCGKLWESSRNKFIQNNMSYGIRIDREAGEVHARDSTSLLLESGSDHNYFYQNDFSHGGNAIFLRPLNGWVQMHNVFIENNASHANNNGVEVWSPGNVFIRNVANYSSYGFWMGGSDQTIIMGNEASHNGWDEYNNNAPEPGFTHGGIVIVNGQGSHVLIEGNRAENNNGGGIVGRGDLGSQGENWKMRHWVVQDNELVDNRWGIYAQHFDWLFVGPNEREGNANPDFLDNATNVFFGEDEADVTAPPKAKLEASERAIVGVPITFDASGSTDPNDAELEYRFDLDGREGLISTQPTVTHTYTEPGHYRVGLTVSNGKYADLEWVDVLVTMPNVEELGTDSAPEEWLFTQEDGQNGVHEVHARISGDRMDGNVSLMFRAEPYSGAMLEATYPRDMNAGWDLTDKSTLSFWIKVRNQNYNGFQGAAPRVTLHTDAGELNYEPTVGTAMFFGGEWSEARFTWLRVDMPLEGGELWAREGNGDLSGVNAVSVGLDSNGYEPVSIWLDGLTFRD